MEGRDKDMKICSSNKRRSSCFYEGAEKWLEIWFTRKDGKTKNCDIRRISRENFVSMLDEVGCQIIGFTRNDFIDSYVLSESSMFVAKQWILLKTCGRTRTLLCLESLFHLVQQHTGFDEVEQLFYSHKNYKRPELQSKPHHTFSEETAVLDAMVPNGAAYCLGAVNRDCWYLYTLSSKISIASVQPLPSLLAAEEVRDKNASNELGDNENYSHDNRASPFADHEVTLEIMMNDLDPEVMKIFTPKVSTTAEEATRLSGIDKIMPNVKIDDHLFYPCGYSMNGIFDNCEYMTIHITPESRFSYVSFESNTPQSSYMELIKRVLNLFRPANFIVTVLAKMMSTQSKDTYVDLQTALYIGEFSRREIQFLSCKSCDLTYALYEK